MNLTTQEERFYTCTPRQAAIAAYAQVEHKDFNTWDYEQRYGSLVKEGDWTYLIGDWSVMKAQPCQA